MNGSLNADNLNLELSDEGELVIEPNYLEFLRSQNYPVESVKETHVVKRDNSDTAHLVVKVETTQLPKNHPDLDYVAHKTNLWVCDCADYLYRRSPDIEDRRLKGWSECTHITEVRRKKENEIVCDECGRVFDTEIGLSRHKGHGHKPYMDREILVDLYWREEKSTHEVANELDTDSGTISRWMDRLDIPKRSKSVAKGGPDLSPEKLYKLYHEQGLSSVEIGERYDIDPTNVTRKMERNGIERRSGFKDAPSWVEEVEDRFGPNWKDQRKKRLEIDGHECSICGMSNEEHKDRHNRSIHVHHIQPRSSFVVDGELDYERANDLDNLISLCYDCHFKWEGVPLRPQVEQNEDTELTFDENPVGK